MIECQHRRRLSFVDGEGFGVFYETMGDKSRRNEHGPSTCTEWAEPVRHAHWCVDCGRMRIGSERTWRTYKQFPKEPTRD